VFKTAPVLCGEGARSRYAVWLFALRAAGFGGRTPVVRFVCCLAAVGGEISAFFMFMHYPLRGAFLMLRVQFGDVVGRFYLIFTDEGFCT
jgi:hypothetical protein